MVFYARIGDAIGISWGDVLRLAQSLADVCTACLVWLIARRTNPSLAPAALAFVMLAPASIFVSGFHGNTDPTMMMFLAAAVWSLTRSAPAPLTGAFLALACSIKLVPLVLLPLFLLFLSRDETGSWTIRRAAGFLSGFAVIFAAVFLPPVLLATPRFIQNVFGYTPAAGGWGVTGILLELSLTPEGAPRPAVLAAFNLYHAAGKWLILIAVGVLSLALFRRRLPLTRFPAVVHVTLCLFLCLTPGFGVQYMAWLVPFAIFALGIRHAAVLVASLSVYLFVTYTIWSRELPWFYGNALWEAPGGWIPNWLAIPLWMFLVWSTVVAVRRLFEIGETPDPPAFELSNAELGSRSERRIHHDV